MTAATALESGKDGPLECLRARDRRLERREVETGPGVVWIYSIAGAVRYDAAPAISGY